MLRRLTLAIALLLCLPALAQAAPHHPVLGAALDSEMPRDQRSDLLAHFDAVTTENAFKWGDMSPGRGQTKFATADRMVAWARRHRLRLRAHNLFWHRLQTPRWVRPLIERSRRPKATLRRLMHDRIRKVVSRYAGRIDVWDVVNEPLALFGAGWDTADTALTAENFFYTTLGERYIDDAFRWTHRADPKGKLFLNELVWNPALGDAKADALLGLVRRLKRRGVPIDGVGIQTHGMLGLAPPSFPGSTASLVRYMRALVRLGVKVEITELDVALPLLPPSPDPLAAQAALFRRVAAACGRVRACTGLTVWGLRDPDTWLDTYEVTAGNAPNRPLLLDARGRPKPAYRAVVDALGIDPPGRSDR